MKFILIAVVILAVVAALALVIWMNKGQNHLAVMTAAYKPDPQNKKNVSVAGWTESEIKTALSDFAGMYAIPSSSFSVTAQSGGSFAITFPKDVEPRLFLFLVNYLRYPKAIAANDRKIGVVGRATLSRAFGIPDDSLEGVEAIIYTPENDSEFDNVFVRTASGKAFKIPFTRLIWELVNDSRVPAEVSRLVAAR